MSDHHAIIPTEQSVLLSDLSDKERKIFDLIVKRFLAVLFPAFEYEQTTVCAKPGAELFIARGKTVLAKGWKEVYDHEIEDEDARDGVAEQLLPAIAKGERLRISGIAQTKGETKPPEPFTEATLLSAMENPAKHMANENQELIKTIGETGGLGTVATRADVIGYREKLGAFQKRRDQEKGGKLSKKEVANYLKGQEMTDNGPACARHACGSVLFPAWAK